MPKASIRDLILDSSDDRIAQALAKAEIDPSREREGGVLTLLHNAASAKRPNVLRLCVARSSLMNPIATPARGETGEPSIDEGKTPLFYAEDPDSVKILVSAGADIHWRTTRGDTCLMRNIVFPNEGDAIIAAIECGADPSAEDAYGLSAYYRLSRIHDPMIRDRILTACRKAGVRESAMNSGLVIEAIVKGEKWEEVLRLLQGCNNIDFGNGSALRSAIKHRNTVAVRELLRMGADANGCELHGCNTNVTVCAEVGDEEVLRLLLENGLDYRKTKWYNTVFDALRGRPHAKRFESILEEYFGVLERSYSVGFISRDVHYALAYIEADPDLLPQHLSAAHQVTPVAMSALAGQKASPAQWAVVRDPGGPWCRAIAIGREPTRADVERWSRATGQRAVLVTNNDTAGVTTMVVYRNGEVIEDFDADSSRGTVLYSVEGKKKKVAWDNCSAFLDKRMQALRLACIQDLPNPAAPSLADVASAYADREKALLVTFPA